MGLRRGAVLCAALTLFGVPAFGKLYSDSFQGKAPPELVSQPGHWIHPSPLTLKGLKGKVVYLEFGFLG